MSRSTTWATHRRFKFHILSRAIEALPYTSQVHKHTRQWKEPGRDDWALSWGCQPDWCDGKPKLRKSATNRSLITSTKYMLWISIVSTLQLTMGEEWQSRLDFWPPLHALHHAPRQSLCQKGIGQQRDQAQNICWMQTRKNLSFIKIMEAILKFTLASEVDYGVHLIKALTKDFPDDTLWTYYLPWTINATYLRWVVSCKAL